MLENLLAALEQEKSSRFQIIAKVDSLITESGEVEPELPASIHDKLGRLQRQATDHIIEVEPVSRYLFLTNLSFTMTSLIELVNSSLLIFRIILAVI